jgi:hypothetical protein
VHDVDAEAFSKVIYCELQLALLGEGSEEVKLYKIVNVDEVVGDKTNEAERTGMIDLVKEFGAN